MHGARKNLRERGRDIERETENQVVVVKGMILHFITQEIPCDIV